MATCKECLKYKQCLNRGDEDAINLTDGVEICRGFAPVEQIKMLVDHIGENVYRICPKCSDRHNESCKNCAWSSALFSQGCTVFGLWGDGQYPPEKCTIVPYELFWNSIPTIANQLGKKCFFTKEEAEAALAERKAKNDY